MPKRKSEAPQDWFSLTFGALIDQQTRAFTNYTKAYPRPLRTPRAKWQAPQGLPQVSVEGRRVVTDYADARLHVEFLTGSMARVWLVRPGEDENPPFSYAVLDDLPQEPLELKLENEETASLSGAMHSYYKVSQQGQTIMAVPQERPQWAILSQFMDVSWREDGSLRLRLLAPDIHSVYGTGERTFDLNLLGRSLTFWNTDAGSYVRGFEPINTTVPLAIFGTPFGYFGLFLDNSGRSVLNLKPQHGEMLIDRLAWEIEGGRLSFFCMTGPSAESIVEQFTALTGRMPMPPLWALGYHQSRYSYASQEEVLAVAREFRERAIPCDVIHLDIHYMDGYHLFTWDKQAFPDPQAMSATLHEMGFKLVTIVDPGVKIDPDYAVYQTGLAQDAFMKWPDGQPVAGVVWPGMTHHPDFTKPAARAWWAEQVRDFVQAYGIDGLWNDMNEPLYFSRGEAISPPNIVQHDYEGQGGTHAQAHNVYGTLMARASREGLQSAYPQRRPFNITRAGWAGAQRYASSWTGDNQSTWDDLRLSIAMNLQMALSGQSFTGPDVGGFANDTEGELLARWTQAACLLPFFRNHSAVDTIRQEPWLFGQEVERICREAIELRYRLMPYLYTAFAQCHFKGTPIIRPVMLGQQALDDCFILGDHIVVAPVLTPHTLRRLIVLPQDDEQAVWIDFWTGRVYAGGRPFIHESPLDHLPIFVRSGALIPTWEGGHQHLGEWPEDGFLTLYGESSEVTSLLYEDAAEGLDEQQGGFVWRSLSVARLGDAFQVSETRHGLGEARTRYQLRHIHKAPMTWAT